MRALFAKFATAILGAGLMMTATAALACNTGCAPPAPPVRPTPPTPPSMPCNCTPNNHNHGGNTNTNVNVNVKTNVNVNASASAASSVFGFAGASAASYGGGYGNWSQTPGVPENAGGLAVETGEAAMDMIAEKRTVTRTIVIQASCIDDTGVPHPASQLSPERAIANDYMGEVYRCIAGTHMSVTMADFGICDDFGAPVGDVRMSERESSSYSRTESHSSSAYDSGYMTQGNGYGAPMAAGPCAPQAIACSAGGYESHGGGYAAGESRESHMVATGARRAGCGANMDFSHINFDGGKTMTCQKGDALWFDHGNLSCKAQIPQRQCNERSLLRRFGVGLKVLTITRTETMQRQVARQVERSSASSTVMTFDGGVGGFVE
jgi:hypothetical protein